MTTEIGIYIKLKYNLDINNIDFHCLPINLIPTEVLKNVAIKYADDVKIIAKENYLSNDILKGIEKYKRGEISEMELGDIATIAQISRRCHTANYHAAMASACIYINIDYLLSILNAEMAIQYHNAKGMKTSPFYNNRHHKYVTWLVEELYNYESKI